MEAEIRNWQDSSNILKCPEYIKEQSIFRLDQIKQKAPECFAKGTCINCGCDIIEKSFEIAACECYPERMDKKTWEKFKKTNNYDI